MSGLIWKICLFPWRIKGQVRSGQDYFLQLSCTENGPRRNLLGILFSPLSSKFQNVLLWIHSEWLVFCFAFFQLSGHNLQPLTNKIQRTSLLHPLACEAKKCKCKPRSVIISCALWESLRCESVCQMLNKGSFILILLSQMFAATPFAWPQEVLQIFPNETVLGDNLKVF